MKEIFQVFIIVFFCISHHIICAQQWSLEPGIGLGLKIPSDWEDRRGGFGLHLGASYYNGKKWSVSVEYQTYGTGTFWSGDLPDISSGATDIFGFNKTNASLYMLNPRYFLNSSLAENSVLFGLAVGVQQIKREIDVNDRKNISRAVFTFAPEVGYKINQMIMALRWYPTQESPGFEAVDKIDNRRKIFVPVRFSFITFHITYSICLLKHEM